MRGRRGPASTATPMAMMANADLNPTRWISSGIRAEPRAMVPIR